MNLFSISGLLTGISCVSMAVWVFLHRQSNRMNMIWASFCVFVSIWGFGGFAIGLAKNPETALLWWRIAYIGVILIPVTFYHFVVKFLELKRSLTLALGYVITGFFLVADFTMLMMPSTTRMFNEFYYLAPPGVLYPYFVAFFIFLVIISHIDMGRELVRSSSGRRREQIKWFFMATAIGFAGDFTCFLPVFGYEIYPYGNFTVPLYPLIMTYAIFRYQLMDIEVVIKRAAVFAGLFMFVYGTFALFTLVGQEFFRNVLGWSPWVATIPTIVVIVLALRPLENFLVEKTDKVLFQKKYDYKRILASFLDEIVTVLNLEEVFEKSIKLLQGTLHPEAIAIYLYDKAKDEMTLYQAIGYEHMVPTLGKDSKIAYLVKDQKRTLSIERQRVVADDIALEMNQLKARVIIPLALDTEMIGMMILGPKKSGNDYSQEELDSLSDLSKAEAIAIKNARYIDELNAAQAEIMRAEAMRQVASMADGLSHQFNNRFQAISAPLGLMKFLIEKTLSELKNSNDQDQKKKLEDILLKVKEGVTRASANAVRGGEIAQGLLKYSRPEKAGYEMQDVSKAFYLGLELMEYKHSDFSQIEIKKNISTDLPHTWSNTSYLQDMYQIVIDNAYDAIKQKQEHHSDHKGVILLTISYDKVRDLICIVIKDNGIGMKPDILEKVQNAVPYVTTKASSSEKSGYGAGVQVLRRLVSFHNGRLNYESAYGDGTTTKIEIPVTQEPKVIEEERVEK